MRIGTLHACHLRVDRIGSILVVDDERAGREMVVELLRGEGLDARSAGSVDEALEALRRGSFGAILSDIQMPAKNGFRLLVELREIGCTIPVILMTSFGTEETAQEAIEAGAFDCLLKPFGRSALLEMVQRALQAGTPLEDPVTGA